jgi:hypothetical protein
MIQTNKSKYEMKIQLEKDELEKSGNRSTKNTDRQSLPGSRNIQQPTQEDYDLRQQQLRIKYGSNKTKQNYYSSRLGGIGQTGNYQAKAHKASTSQMSSAIKQSSTRNLRTSSVSS